MTITNDVLDLTTPPRAQEDKRFGMNDVDMPLDVATKRAGKKRGADWDENLDKTTIMCSTRRKTKPQITTMNTRILNRAGADLNRRHTNFHFAAVVCIILYIDGLFILNL